MRRKIEKYLAKKQGVDEANVRYTEDGRFDFMGDLEGVLSAVRGKENLGKVKRTDRKARRSSTKKKKFDPKMAHLGMPPPYMPYGMPPMHYPGMPPHPGMYPHDMSMGHPYPYPMAKPPAKSSKDTNIPLAPKPTVSEKPGKALSPKNSTTESESELRHPFMDISMTPAHKLQQQVPGSGFLSSSRKSMFASPKPVGDESLEVALNGSPSINMSGMTPLSTFKGAFSTPYSSELFSELSLEDNLTLNKALFADDDHPSKTPLSKSNLSKTLPQTPREMRLMIGGSEDSMSSFISDMRYNRVSISPVSHKAKVQREMQDKTPLRSINKSIHFADEHNDILNSVTKVNSMMPSVTATEEAQSLTPNNVTNITQDSINTGDVHSSSPFDTSLTPIGAYDQSFWGNQLGFSPQNTALTPFKSPHAPLSIKKERAPLSVLDVNTMKNKIPESLRKSSIRKMAEIKSEPEPSPKRRRVEVTGKE